MSEVITINEVDNQLSNKLKSLELEDRKIRVLHKLSTKSEYLISPDKPEHITPALKSQFKQWCQREDIYYKTIEELKTDLESQPIYEVFGQEYELEQFITPYFDLDGPKYSDQAEFKRGVSMAAVLEAGLSQIKDFMEECFGIEVLDCDFRIMAKLCGRINPTTKKYYHSIRVFVVDYQVKHFELHRAYQHFKDKKKSDNLYIDFSVCKVRDQLINVNFKGALPSQKDSSGHWQSINDKRLFQPVDLELKPLAQYDLKDYLVQYNEGEVLVPQFKVKPTTVFQFDHSDDFLSKSLNQNIEECISPNYDAIIDLLDKLDPKPLQYSEWVNVFFVLMSELGYNETTLKVFDWWSQRDELRYQEQFIKNNLYRQYANGNFQKGVSFGTLIHYVKKYNPIGLQEWKQDQGGKKVYMCSDYERVKEEFEQNHAVIQKDARIVEVRLDKVKNQVMATYYNQADMQLKYGNLNYIAKYWDGKREVSENLPFFKKWVKDPNRRDLHQIVFKTDIEKYRDCFNIYDGFAVDFYSPDNGSYKPFKQLVEGILFNNSEKYNPTFNWLTYFFKYRCKTQLCLVFKSTAKGVGKSSLVKSISLVIGEKYFKEITKPDSQIFGRFSEANKGKFLINMSETLMDWKFYSELKKMITEGRQDLEQKNIQGEQSIDDISNFIVDTNKHFEIESNERRFQIMECTNAFMKEKGEDWGRWYNTEYIKNPANLRAIYDWLVSRKLPEDYHPQKDRYRGYEEKGARNTSIIQKLFIDIYENWDNSWLEILIEDQDEDHKGKHYISVQALYNNVEKLFEEQIASHNSKYPKYKFTKDIFSKQINEVSGGGEFLDIFKAEKNCYKGKDHRKIVVRFNKDMIQKLLKSQNVWDLVEVGDQVDQEDLDMLQHMQNTKPDQEDLDMLQHMQNTKPELDLDALEEAFKDIAVQKKK